MLSNRVSVTLGTIFVAALVALSCHHGLGGGIGSDFRGFEDATLDELFDALDDNELRAKDTYLGRYVRVTGILRDVDVDGAYVTIDDGDFLTSRSIRCDLVTDDARRDAADVSKGDEVAVRGKVTDVFDGLFSRGYTIDAYHVDAVSEAGGGEQGESAEGATEESEDEQSEAEVVPEGAIVLEAGVAGDYGRSFEVYGGGSDADVGTRLGWFVPAGDYVVENLGGSGAWEQVNYGSAEPVVNADGHLESSGFQCVLVKPHETAEISVPEGGCVYIVDGDTRLALTRR